jgi:5-hydroxyisourate hydrolase-like protein (transthyretin family)
MNTKAQIIAMLLTAGLFVCACNPAAAAVHIEGQVQGGGGPIANSTVTLWAASANAPSQLAQVATDADGRFEISVEQSPGKDTILYLIATAGEPAVNKAGGDNPAIALMTVVGSKSPAKVIINEMTTIASVWTHNQFLDGTAIKGPALSLRSAHCCGQRAQLRRSRNRWLGVRHSGPVEQ